MLVVIVVTTTLTVTITEVKNKNPVLEGRFIHSKGEKKDPQKPCQRSQQLNTHQPSKQMCWWRGSRIGCWLLPRCGRHTYRLLHLLLPPQGKVLLPGRASLSTRLTGDTVTGLQRALTHETEQHTQDSKPTAAGGRGL